MVKITRKLASFNVQKGEYLVKTGRWGKVVFHDPGLTPPQNPLTFKQFQMMGI
jgi:hypothetical protein